MADMTFRVVETPRSGFSGVYRSIQTVNSRYGFLRTRISVQDLDDMATLVRTLQQYLIENTQEGASNDTAVSQ